MLGKKNISIGEKDKQLNILEAEIKKRKELLLLKTKQLEQDKTKNKYLEGVSNQYKNYYDTVVKEKQQQHDSMMLLKEYLDDLIKNEKITSRQIQDAKREQRAVILEIEKITQELKNIV
jgi:hypothetical protein